MPLVYTLSDNISLDIWNK